MTWLKFVIISAIIIGSGVVSWQIQERVSDALQKSNTSLQLQANLLAELQEEHARLSDLVANAQNSESLTEDEFRELLRLRNEVGRLRGQKLETDQLHATNQMLRATLAQGDKNPDLQPHWAREEIANAGFSDPESAIITTLWAVSSGDPDSSLAMLTPEEKAQLTNEGKLEEVLAYYHYVGTLLNPPDATGISLVGKKVNSPDEVILDLYYEGEGKTRKFMMKRVAGQWKFQDLVSIIAN